MAWGRRYRRRRPYRRRYRRTRRTSMRRLRRAANVNRAITYVKRTQIVELSRNVATQYLEWNPSFALSNMPGYSEFTAVWDQFCIRGIRVKVQPNFSSVFSDATTLPTYVTAIDKNSNMASSSYNNLQLNVTARHAPLWRPQTRFWKPTLTMTAAGGAFTTLNPKRWTWVSTGSASTTFYGFKAMSQAVIPDLKFTGFITYYVAFKQITA